MVLFRSDLARGLDSKGAMAFSAQKKGQGIVPSSPGAVAREFARLPSPSRLPPDVVRDYGYNASHLLGGAGAPLYAHDERYAKFLERLRQFPPEILIVGKDAPLTHSLGPVLSFGGENRTFPAVPNRRGEDPRRLLSPDEFRLRIKAVERFVQDVHAAGVKTVIPYISPMTALGNAEKRLGFFRFYDDWDKYERDFDLGARPPGDPLNWTQRDREGKNYFRMGGGQEDEGGLTRYSMCVNHPGWRRWQMLVADWIARAGYDGVWMDNVLVHRCFDKYCQGVAKEMGADLFREPNPVWLESYLRYFDDLRAEGARRRAGFYLGGNYIDLPYQREVTDKLDLCMIERVWLGAPRVLWPGGVWTGFYPAASNPKAGAAGAGRSLNNLWLVQLAYAMRGNRGTHLLAGTPLTKSPEFAHNEDSAVLALAEGATFGGGIAVQVTGQFPLNTDVDLPAHKARQRFFTFARERRELYERLLPAGNVAVVVFPGQDDASIVEAQQVRAALLWRGLLVDVLDGDKQSVATLARYALVVVPGRQTLPPWMKTLPLLQGLDPLTPEEVTGAKKSYRKGQVAPQIRQTKLADLAAERAGPLRALTVPQNSLIEGSAWANEQRMVLHLLNFRVPVGLANGERVGTITNIPVRLKLPRGKAARQVRIYSTDAPQAKAVAFRQQGDIIEFTVPSMRVYAVCEATF